ncbi:hypothetical protein GGI03_001245 [Coemansia sp. RSA 2337]|nr:hypothetical protein H4S03_004955 [Coemansia sp. S3946]KAJ2054347.1 hypothetical protein H4S04_000040 [Coemansia sp. S16]KAJ2066514.1 hypothetical protein GGI08_001830 [Coemansia sp. S2]KAJ2075930.1 hypothetical protein GGH13_000263 [Coemansia sp. S155-1]KAJ2118244.1 hypothetical protein IW146_000095 [Coemansia sp. RSA 922]KAJ2353632.1 hypothetical protein GGH92_000534 [Coemansia sp. RSA 2673]KAJ2468015.1 hypothetical protein GGI03_001245 [Coemansia sp. RSA 2337]
MQSNRKTSTRHTSSSPIQAQEFELSSIDIAQGDADLNFVLFYYGASKRHKKRRLPVGRLKASLISAVQQFPIMLGRAVPTSDNCGLKVVVDPDNLNWPDITEVSASNMSIASLQRNGFAWSHWPQATYTMDLAQRPFQPMVGVHIVRYVCGGISVHIKIRHLIVDGNGAWRFYSVWAQICQDMCKKYGGRFLACPQDKEPLLPSRLPMFDKLLPPVHSQGIEKASDVAAEYIDKMLQFFDRVTERRLHTSSVFSADTYDYSVRKFALTHKAVTRLKAVHGQLANCSPEHMPFVRAHNITYVSTNDLVCSVFWRAITRAHYELDPSDPNTCMMLACDMRSRIGLPPTYTGNASFPLIMHMDKSQMQRQTITDTATWIRQQLSILSPAYARNMSLLLSISEDLQKLISIFHPSNSFFSASIVNGFPMFDMVDFGFGKPVHIDIPAYITPGFSLWMPTRTTGQSAKAPTTNIDIALREDIYQLIINDSEFNEYLEVLY